MSALQEYVAGWVPDEVSVDDLIGPGPARALARVLGEHAPPGYDPPSGSLPLLWHWLYFLDWPAHEELGRRASPDGALPTAHSRPPPRDRGRARPCRGAGSRLPLGRVHAAARARQPVARGGL
ncbi:hypothetical protein [Halostreptopolyspora alba]|uniref:hypothetical protein n=1 Tax=Halostreptopolyspora alba TaxID=2487137 RepID=UPI00371F383A